MRYAHGTRHVPDLKEADIERTCDELLQMDGWRSIKMEQNFSERKRKLTGESGMADRLYIRYTATLGHPRCFAQIVWIEFKRAVRGKATKAKPKQTEWHLAERARGALTLIAGEDFPATIDGFREFYKTSGLARV